MIKLISSIVISMVSNKVYIGTVLDMLRLVYPDASDEEIGDLHVRAMKFSPRALIVDSDVHHSHWSIAATMIWLSSLAYSRIDPSHRRTQSQISIAIGDVSVVTMSKCRKTIGFENLVIHS